LRIEANGTGTADKGGFAGYVFGGILMGNHNNTGVFPLIGYDERNGLNGPSDDI
jgi:hypothetical protein